MLASRGPVSEAENGPVRSNGSWLINAGFWREGSAAQPPNEGEECMSPHLFLGRRQTYAKEILNANVISYLFPAADKLYLTDIRPAAHPANAAKTDRIAA